MIAAFSLGELIEIGISVAILITILVKHD